MTNTTQPPQNAPSQKYPSICRWIAIAFLVLIILVGLIVLIVWLSIKPKHLVYTIDNGSIHNYNLTNDHLKANFNFTLRAYNPNSKVSIYYNRIETTAFYDDATIAFNSINPFHQPRRNVTHIGLFFEVKDVPLSESAARELRMERVRGRIDLEIKVKAKVRFKVGAWKSRHRTLRLTCGPVTVPFSSSKNFKATVCDVDL